MINWDFELEKWRSKWRTINGGPSSTASHFWPVEWEGKITLLPVQARESQVHQLLPTMGNSSQIAELPARLLGLKPGRRVLDYKESLLCAPPPLFFYCSGPTEDQCQSSRNLGVGEPPFHETDIAEGWQSSPCQHLALQQLMESNWVTSPFFRLQLC